VGLNLTEKIIKEHLVRSGSVVTVDPDKGIVYFGALK
jgi:phosphohistidine swiveling domain-containing protein